MAVDCIGFLPILKGSYTRGVCPNRLVNRPPPAFRKCVNDTCSISANTVSTTAIPALAISGEPPPREGWGMGAPTNSKHFPAIFKT